MAIVKTYQETISHYQNMRLVAYEQAERQFASLGIKLCEISRGLAAEADMWAHQPGGVSVPWSWVNAFGVFNRTRAKRFDVAITVGGKLYALCYGVPSQNKFYLKLKIISGKQAPSPIKGKALDIVLYTAGIYAKLLGSGEIWICEPLNDRLVALYESRGYTSLVQNGTVSHLVRKI